MMLKFTQDHEWLNLDGDIAVVGITDYAQRQLGDLVYVELPEIDRTVKQGEAVVVVESCKAASDVYAPVDGTIIAINETIKDAPELVNSEAQAGGWLFKIKLSQHGQVDSLLDPAAYAALVE